MKQMDRRLLILMRLRDELPLRAADLALECECSVRTIYRDIDALCQAGVPVAAMPGEGYRLVQGYHLPPIAFTVEEAVQLLLGAELARGLGTHEQRESARAAAAKVEAVLQPETRREVDHLRERIRVSSWHREASPWLPVLQRGVIEERVVRLRYHSFSSDEVTEREVEPYFLIFYSNDWHLVGYCRLRESVRDFRCSRIREATLLAERFERPEGIHPHDDGPPDHAGTEVRVWIEQATVPWARETPAFGLAGEEPTEGGSIFVFRSLDLRRLLPWILSWGMSARVLSPPYLAARIRDEADALARSYAEG
jgi:predicted DNA-binding transcriptional regulator YafY